VTVSRRKGAEHRVPEGGEGIELAFRGESLRARRGCGSMVRHAGEASMYVIWEQRTNLVGDFDPRAPLTAASFESHEDATRYLLDHLKRFDHRGENEEQGFYWAGTIKSRPSISTSS
jgi:hypothetical protein